MSWTPGYTALVLVTARVRLSVVGKDSSYVVPRRLGGMTRGFPSCLWFDVEAVFCEELSCACISVCLGDKVFGGFRDRVQIYESCSGLLWSAENRALTDSFVLFWFSSGRVPSLWGERLHTSPSRFPASSIGLGHRQRRVSDLYRADSRMPLHTRSSA